MRRSENRTHGSSLSQIVTAAGIGAALAYLFDPVAGKRRRSLLRDQAVHLSRTSARAADAVLHDMGNRIYGSFAEWRSTLREGIVPDDVLVERVRSQMGRYVTRSSSIDVTASAGRVTLRGVVPEEEEPELVSGVKAVRGVKSVENRLEVQSSVQ